MSRVVPDEKRTGIRYPVSRKLRYSYEQGTFVGQAVNISRGGIRFDCAHPVPPMTRVDISLLPEPETVFKGITVWTEKGADKYSIGVIFDSLSEEQAYYLDMLLREVAA